MNSVIKTTLAAVAAIGFTVLATPASAEEPNPQAIQDCLDRHPEAVMAQAVTEGNDLVCVRDKVLPSPGDDTYLWVGADVDEDIILRGNSEADPGVDTLSLADWTLPLIETYNEVGHGGLFGVRVIAVDDPEVVRYTALNDVIGDPNLCGRVGGPNVPDLALHTGGGADTVRCTFANIFTEGGDDVVIGVEQNVTVNAGAGDDKVIGDAGADTITLGTGNDRAFVEWGGADVVKAGAGDDTVWATRKDTVRSAQVR